MGSNRLGRTALEAKTTTCTARTPRSLRQPYSASHENAELGCKIDAEWRSGCSCTTHTGIHESQTSLCTNDINADSTPPEAHIEIVEDSSFTDFVEFIGYQQTPTGKQDENGNWIW